VTIGKSIALVQTMRQPVGDLTLLKVTGSKVLEEPNVSATNMFGPKNMTAPEEERLFPFPDTFKARTRRTL
jgi:hypothetical protein